MTGVPAPQVSVIVRSMARATLSDALDSLGTQRDVDAEVIVVAACGASHPELPEACGPHRLRLVASHERLLRAAAANAGLEAATGAWITFLDDDDRFEPDHLAGLLAAARDAPQAGVITSYAKGVFSDGHVEWFGRPFSLAQLYEGNFVHLSAAIFRRDLVIDGCRFDESFAILEDWDFMLQLAQRASFQFVPLGSFLWHADAGDSGAGAGANHDPVKFAAQRDRVYEKWGPASDALMSRTQPLLEQAAQLVQAGRLADADALCHQVLAISVNDPWALNLRAMLLRQGGRLTDARSVQAHAAAVRPNDGGFVYNLALLDRAAGDLEAARRHARKATQLAPDFAPAQVLVAELG